MDDALELDRLFHRLNNKLGIILANAELLESKLTDHSSRERAGQIVAGAVDAIAAAQDILTRSKQSDDE